MAQFKPCRVTSDKLDSLAIKNGQLILVTDTKKIYSDISDTERILVGGDGVMSAAATNYDYFINDLATDYASYSPVLLEWTGEIETEEGKNQIELIAQTWNDAEPMQGPFIAIYNYTDGIVYEVLNASTESPYIRMAAIISQDNIINSGNVIAKIIYANSGVEERIDYIYATKYDERYQTGDNTFEDDLAALTLQYVNFDKIAMKSYVDMLVGDVESVLERLTTGEGV